MVDKIQKSLNKFSEKEKKMVKDLLLKIKINDINSLDIKKLKGHNNIFRARKGKIRIIYRIEKTKLFVLAIEKRSKRTYTNIK